VISQTFKNWELFIMDDASNEETEEVIKQYLDDSRIYYYNSHVKDEHRYKTTRYATLINQAIPLSKGEYISYLTDDNRYSPNRLDVMVNYLKQHPNVEIVYSAQKVQKIGRHQNITSELIRRTRGALRRAANIVDHCSVMHTRKLADQVHKKHGSYWDDNPKYWHNGDAAFWKRLNEFQSFYPINQVLDIGLKLPTSFQNLNAYLPDTIPDGTLVKGLSSEVYLIDQKKRRKITNEMFKKLNYKKTKIIEIPDPALYKYKEGHEIDHTIFDSVKKFPNQRLITKQGSPFVYYIENNQKRHIVSNQTFKRFHFNSSEVVVVDPAVLFAIPEGPKITQYLGNNMPLPDGLSFKHGTDMFIGFNNSFHPVVKKVAAKLKLTLKDAVPITKQNLRQYNRGKPFDWTLHK
jgi:spore maturation protein CgeD